MPDEQKGEATPEDWRAILRDIDYPDEVRAGPWRGRRGRKRAHRQAVRRRTKKWVAQERRRDPIRPTAAVIVVALVLGIGLGTRYLWPGLLGDHRASGTAVASASPSAPQAAPATRPGSGFPAPSARPSAAVDLSTPEKTAEGLVRAYLTRNPPQDKNHTAPVLRAAPYMAPALVENLASSSDPAWDRLVSRGGISTVGAVKTGPADSALPPDSPIRVWRKAEATVNVEGYTKYSEQTVLQIELTSSAEGWHATRILGL
ncbi:hypothetical protein CTZ27_35445 [Streptomyces griseocarneus]|nr:hypothetical protein CTZ27_35445 [Streptomyces griseocarneus]